MRLDRTRVVFSTILGITLFIILISLGIINIPAGCNGFPTPTSTSTPMSTLTSSPSVATLTSTLTPTSLPTPTPTSTPTKAQHSMVRILVDDFNPQPFPWESVYMRNRLGGDRGAVNDSIMAWGDGNVTTTISAGKSWGGGWISLNHAISEQVPINFSAILPSQIESAYQSEIVGITAVIADSTPGIPFRLELKNRGEVQWDEEYNLTGGQQIITVDLPNLGNINELLWVLDDANAGDFVVLESISFAATTQITDTATAAFVWSYGMLLQNWNPETGLVRDKSRDANGEFDAIQATGSLAAATAIAEQLGIVSRANAIQIVNKISDTLLNELPRYHGLLPHWVKISPEGKFNIVNGTEWSSVDTTIAAMGLLGAKSSLALDTSDVEHMLQIIDWHDLKTVDGISHGYDNGGNRLASAWNVFGGESWLVELVYAGATGQVSSIPFTLPPTANGSGFIDEMAWLFVSPPPELDYWEADWKSYRLTAANDQISYYVTNYPESCLNQFGLFGLSASEIPYAAMANNGGVYQAFGIGGQFSAPNDGSAMGEPVVVPHYAAMIASIRPKEAIAMWEWLIQNEYFSPLNNVESLAFLSNQICEPAAATWNHLKGSWNLSLQTLGWGNYLIERNGQQPVLWQAATVSPLLSRGYTLLTSEKRPSTTTSPAWSYERECENPDAHTIGQTLVRTDASATTVHGQFGTVDDGLYPEQAGDVQYINIETAQIERLFVQLRYSKNSQLSTPILIYIDDETLPRAAIYPANQGSWEQFSWTEPILLGSIDEGTHTIIFFTEGQQYGVADLDKFVLMSESALP